MKNNDVELIRRILAGDENAFVSLVKKYQKQVHALAWRKIGDFHIAEEITQDTFLKVYQKLSTLKDPNQFSGWLYVIATNQCRAWLRKKRIETESLEDTDIALVEGGAYSRYVADEHAKATVEAQREVVKKLLAKLKESERTVMTLHYFGNMTCEEISRFLGVSTSTIKLRLHRARQRLQKEEPMIREALSNFQLSPYLTDNIMKKIDRIKPAAPSGSKPLVPWVLGASTALLIALMLGMGSQYLVRFQQPYSLDAQSEMMVKLIDAPIVQNLEAIPDIQNQLGGQTGNNGRGDGIGQKSNQVLSDKEDNTQWRLPDARKIRLRTGGIIGNLDFSPDSTQLAIPSSVGIWIYDRQTSEELNQLKENRGLPHSISFSPDGKTLASGEKMIVLWDVPTGQQKTVLTTRLDEAGVMSLNFSADGRFLVSSHRDGTVRLFDVATAQQKTILTGHTGEVWCVSFSPDGKTLASACGTELWLWDVTTRKYKSIDIDLEVYDEKQGGEKIFRNPVVFNLSFSPDGKTLATAHKDTTVRLWDVETRTAKTILKGHTDFVMSVCFAPDGKTLVSGSWDKTVRLWDVVTGHHKATLEGHNEIIKGVAFSPDGKTIASGSVDGTIFLWNLTSSDNTLDDAN